MLLPVLHVLEHSILDALAILGASFLLYFLLSFFEKEVAQLLGKNNRLAPAAGAALGLIPQCGISVVGADLYTKHHLSAGTLLALFLACSDEALPILISGIGEDWAHVLLLLAIKMVGGFLLGFLLDLLLYRSKREVKKHHEHCHGEDESQIRGCCGHHIEGAEENALYVHLLHPLYHSLKIFAISFVVIFAFGTLMEFYEEQISAFLVSNYYAVPVYSAIIGLIPNCASSVLIANLYMEGVLPFSALVSGLCVNAGLGYIVLFQKGNLKNAIMITVLTFVSALALGYFALLFA